MLVISTNASDRAEVRQLLLTNGFRESWLNEMNAGEFLYFEIDMARKSFNTIKHDDFKSLMSYTTEREILDVMSSSIFKGRFHKIKYD